MESDKVQVKTALVLGAGGFIGSHMVKRLKAEGYWVRGVDLKYPEFSTTAADEFQIFDLRHKDAIRMCCVLNYGVPFEESILPDEIYNFACLMGGAGFIFTGDNDADIMTSAMINFNLVTFLTAFKESPKIFYSSSACMYPQDAQELNTRCALPESLAYPANPDSEYGWEKLFSERLYLTYARNYGLNVRIARFHNIYGPEGTYAGGKEKAPAAICRKVCETKINEDGRGYTFPKEKSLSIDIWGDGNQTRSFLYIDDCIDAVRLLMQSEFKQPINIGSEEMVSINQLADIAIELSGRSIEKKYDLTKPQGVRGRNSNNELIREVLGWEPKFTLQEGMEKTFNWINHQFNG